MTNIKYKKKHVKLEFGIYNKENPTNSIQNMQIPKMPIFTQERQVVQGSMELSKKNFSQSTPLDQKYKLRLVENLNRIHEIKFHNSNCPVVDFINGELIVSFDFSRKLVERFKGLDKCERAWDPDLKSWRVFVGSFDEVFDILGKNLKLTSNAFHAILDFIETPYYSCIAKTKLGKLVIRESWFKELTLENVEDKNEENLDFNIDQFSSYPFLRKPLNHQLLGISYLYNTPSAGLFDEMGCGKTYQIVNTLIILLKNNVIKNAVIVVPKSLIFTWQNEFLMSGVDNFTTVSGTPKEREKKFTHLTNLIITSYEVMKIEQKHFINYLKQDPAIIVFDESQKLKNIRSEVSKAAIMLRNFSKRCVIATGTPITNRPLDLFSQYLVMDKGRVFGKNFEVFKNTFCNMEQKSIVVNRKTIQIEKFVSVRNIEILNKKVNQSSLRRLKSDVLDLPTLVYKDYIVEMKGDQLKLYNEEIKNFKLAVLNDEASSISHHMIKLNQISSNPKLFKESYLGCNAKIDELKLIVEDLLSQDNKKTIIWTHFVANVEMLKSHFEELTEVSVHTGEMSVAARNSSVENFCNNPNCKIFIATVQSAKEGLTLLPKDGVSILDTMIYFDLDFDAGSYVQSQARFHRIGQTSEKCLIIHILAHYSIDFYIKKNIIEKIETNKDVLLNSKSNDSTLKFSKEYSASLI